MLLALFTGSLKNKEEAESNKGLNYFLAGLLAFFIIGIEFKLMHWPGAGVFVVIAYILSFSLPIILMAQKSDFKVPRQFMITFFTYFILLIALFPKNPLTQFFKGGAIMNSESPAPENQSPLAN